ncbi:MAG: hypothetical protein J6Q57_03605 [Paraprevotella sp.]|nr:hypothetical protein [Paraprevotella sp.]
MKRTYIMPDTQVMTLETQTMLASSTITTGGDGKPTVTPGDAIHNGEFDVNTNIWDSVW